MKKKELLIFTMGLGALGLIMPADASASSSEDIAVPPEDDEADVAGRGEGYGTEPGGSGESTNDEAGPAHVAGLVERVGAELGGFTRLPNNDDGPADLDREPGAEEPRIGRLELSQSWLREIFEETGEDEVGLLLAATTLNIARRGGPTPASEALERARKFAASFLAANPGGIGQAMVLLEAVEGGSLDSELIRAKAVITMEWLREDALLHFRLAVAALGLDWPDRKFDGRVFWTAYEDLGRVRARRTKLRHAEFSVSREEGRPSSSLPSGAGSSLYPSAMRIPPAMSLAIVAGVAVSLLFGRTRPSTDFRARRRKRR